MNVAVVIPAYESEKFVAEAVTSARKQTVEPSEIVVVDDGSADMTAMVAGRAGARVVRQDNRGPGAARNRGVRETSAELIAFLDADDRFVATKLERQLAEIGDCVACGTDAFLDRSGGLEELATPKNAGKSVARVLGFEDLLRGNPLICSSMIVRRDAFERAGGFDEDRELIATEDYDLWLRLGGPIAYLDEPLVAYRQHGASLSDDLTFAAGIDKIMKKVAASHPGHDLTRLIEQRRARVRIDAAWHLAHRGEGAAAREQLSIARSLGARGPGLWKIWLRSWMTRS